MLRGNWAAACICGAVAVSALAAAAQGVMIEPVADAVVVNSTPDENYGALDRIYTWTGYMAGWRGRSYIKFATGGLADWSRVATATLNLYLFDGGGFVPSVNIHHVSEDTWGEMTVTWNNRPLADPSAAELIVSQNTGFGVGWKSFDLLTSGVWDYSGDVADGYVSMLIRSGENGDESHSFYSKEETVLEGHYGPYLRVTLLGDVRLDDAVNALDIGPFIARLTSGEYQAEADCNRDGVVNALDIAGFVGCVTHPMGAAGGASAVPEPGTAGAVVAGLVMLGRRRRG